MDIKFNNPISESWHADPEARIYNGKYYIYVTRSLAYEQQLNHDMFVSDDLEHWEKIESIIDIITYSPQTISMRIMKAAALKLPFPIRRRVLLKATSANH